MDDALNGEVQDVCDLDGQEAARLHRNQRHKINAVAIGIGAFCGSLEREARLANAARPDNG
jgi:hypothetical protein